MPNANQSSAGGAAQSSSRGTRNRNRHHGNSNIDSRRQPNTSRQTPFFPSSSLGSELNLIAGPLDGSSNGTPAHAHTTTHHSVISMNATGGFFEGPYGPSRGGTNSSSVSGGTRAALGVNFSSLKDSVRAGGFRTPTTASSSSNAMSGAQWFPTPAGILPELAVPHTSRQHLMSRAHRDRRSHHCNRHASYGGAKGGSLVPSPPPACLNLIYSLAGDSLLFSETNMDWTKLNIFRTRLCDRLTQTHTCHMANRCLFSHDVNWPRRTPFLPRATALTLRYIPVWCPRLSWPPLIGLCDSSGKISWTSPDVDWDARSCHQRCTRGDNCPFVHNVEEFLYHPEVYKTRSCCLANDDNFEEQMNSNCVALCPWYFCPFAHDVYELRDLRASRFAWHPPPQIVDNQFVARTQDFNELELRIIEFVRRSASGSFDLYTSANSPLRQLVKLHMPPVIRPITGSSLEQLTPSSGHRESSYDDLLYTMVTASFLNLLLYPVENFYVPTLLSLQCAVVQSHLQISGTLDCAELLARYDSRMGTGGSPGYAASKTSGTGSEDIGGTSPESPRLRTDGNAASATTPPERRNTSRTKQLPPMLPLGNLGPDFEAMGAASTNLTYRHFPASKSSGGMSSAMSPEPSSGRSARHATMYSSRHSPAPSFPQIIRRTSPSHTPTAGSMTTNQCPFPSLGNMTEQPKSLSGNSTNRRRNPNNRSTMDNPWKSLESAKSPRIIDMKKTDASGVIALPLVDVDLLHSRTLQPPPSDMQPLMQHLALDEDQCSLPGKTLVATAPAASIKSLCQPSTQNDAELSPDILTQHTSSGGTSALTGAEYHEDEDPDLRAILDFLKPEELLQMMTLIQNSHQSTEATSEQLSPITGGSTPIPQWINLEQADIGDDHYDDHFAATGQERASPFLPPDTSRKNSLHLAEKCGEESSSVKV